MATISSHDVVDLDGRTGEGGGQVVRIALTLSALTGIPIRIHHIRGNRPHGKVGLKRQHVACCSSLAAAVHAEVKGGYVCSETLEFTPSLSREPLQNRKIKIDADTSASSLLVFQSIFPFLLFSADESDSPLTLTIRGGTHVNWSPTSDYIDQVLLPALDHLDIGVPIVGRRIRQRGWNHGPEVVGDLEFTFKPLSTGHSLQTSNWPVLQAQPSIEKIDITIVVPTNLRENLRDALVLECGLVFPNIDTEVVVDEDSNHKARIYTLLVAHTESGFRFGRDYLYNSKIVSAPAQLATAIAKKVVLELNEEIQSGRGLDEHLQDQLIIFQALARGLSSVNGKPEVLAALQQHNAEDVTMTGVGLHQEAIVPMTAEETSVPFGDGSMHTKTARWVVSQILPEVRWYDDGKICEGVGWVARHEKDD